MRAQVKCRRLGMQITCTHSIYPDTSWDNYPFFFCINNEKVITFWKHQHKKRNWYLSLLPGKIKLLVAMSTSACCMPCSWKYWCEIAWLFSIIWQLNWNICSSLQWTSLLSSVFMIILYMYLIIKSYLTKGYIFYHTDTNWIPKTLRVHFLI